MCLAVYYVFITIASGVYPVPVRVVPASTSARFITPVRGCRPGDGLGWAGLWAGKTLEREALGKGVCHVVTRLPDG